MKVSKEKVSRENLCNLVVTMKTKELELSRKIFKIYIVVTLVRMKRAKEAT